MRSVSAALRGSAGLAGRGGLSGRLGGAEGGSADPAPCLVACCEFDVIDEFLYPLGGCPCRCEHGAERCVAKAAAFPGLAVRVDHEFAEASLVRAEDPEAFGF